MGFPACTRFAVTRCRRCASYAAITRETPTYSFPSAAGQSVLSVSTGSFSASGRPPRCHSRSTPGRVAMPVSAILTRAVHDLALGEIASLDCQVYDVFRMKSASRKRTPRAPRSGTRGIIRSPSVSMLGLSPVAGAVLAAKYWPNDGVILCARRSRPRRWRLHSVYLLAVYLLQTPRNYFLLL